MNEIKLTKRDYLEMVYQSVGACLAGSFFVLNKEIYGFMVLLFGVGILIIRRKYDLFLLEDSDEKTI